MFSRSRPSRSLKEETDHFQGTTIDVQGTYSDSRERDDENNSGESRWIGFPEMDLRRKQVLIHFLHWE